MVCGLCHGSGYMVVEIDEVAPCENPDCDVRETSPVDLADYPDALIRHLSVETLYRSIPESNAGQDAWLRTIYPHLTAHQRAELAAFHFTERHDGRRNRGFEWGH